MSPSEYWQIIETAVSKLPFPYNILLALIIFVLILFYVLNKDSVIKRIQKYVKLNREKINYSLKMALFLLIILLAGFFIYDNFYSPNPPEDILVVAISPFYYIDESGREGSDINTANDFKEKLEERKDLKIKVIMLETTIHNTNEAKSQGKDVGAHLVIYGESKHKMGNIDEIKYYILPLLSLEIPSEMPFLQDRTIEEKSVVFTGKAEFSIIREDPISVIESLKENASSAISIIGAFEKYRKSNFTSAITFFKSVKNYENTSSILFYIANCYYFNNNLNESLQYLDKDLEINPLLVEDWNNKGVILFIWGRYEEALKAYSKAIEINPNLTQVWNGKGRTFDNLGRYEEALVAFNKALEIDPQDAGSWNGKGNTLDNLGRYEEALVAYTKAIEIDPQDAGLWYNKGVVLRNLGRYREANKAFERAHEINPTFEIPFNTTVNLTRTP